MSEAEGVGTPRPAPEKTDDSERKGTPSNYDASIRRDRRELLRRIARLKKELYEAVHLLADYDLRLPNDAVRDAEED